MRDLKINVHLLRHFASSTRLRLAHVVFTEKELP